MIIFCSSHTDMQQLTSIRELRNFTKKGRERGKEEGFDEGRKKGGRKEREERSKLLGCLQTETRYDTHSVGLSCNQRELGIFNVGGITRNKNFLFLGQKIILEPSQPEQNGF